MSTIGDRLDFTGVWKTRGSRKADVRSKDEDIWFGDVIYTEVDEVDGPAEVFEAVVWDENGRCEKTSDYDLMERISERWSKERSGE